MIVGISVGTVNANRAGEISGSSSREGRGERRLEKDDVAFRHAVLGRQEELARRADNDNLVEEAEEPGLFIVETTRVRSEEHVVRDRGPQPRLLAVERLAGRVSSKASERARKSERASKRASAGGGG